MSSGQEHPTRDELLAMAYVDDELAADVRTDFAQRFDGEPQLARMVVEYQKLELLARDASPAEPMDSEWKRLEEDAVQRSTGTLGWLLLVLSGLGIVIWGVVQLALSPELDTLPKVLLMCLLAGLFLIFLLILRARLRTMPFDPYTDVKR